MNARVVANVRAWLDGLNARERRLVIAAAVLVAIALFWLVVLLPLHTMNAKRLARVEKKQADLVWMREVAPQVAVAAASGGSAATSNESLVVLIDRTARQAGLGSSLRDQSPNGAHSLRLRLESAPFDSLVAWLALLQQQHGVGVETANVDVGSAPGLVNASVTVGQSGAG